MHVVFLCGVGVLCAVKAVEAWDGKKKAYNHCQQIMSLSLCVEGAGVSAQATIYEYGA